MNDLESHFGINKKLADQVAAELSLGQLRKRIRKSRSKLIGWTYTVSRRRDQLPEESFWGATPEAAVLAKLRLRGLDPELQRLA
jgi:hypothetical protein